MIDTIYIWTPSEPEGEGLSDEDIEILTPWCFLCGIGEDHKNIKVCPECQDYFD
jgi:hypothetical protein